MNVTQLLITVTDFVDEHAEINDAIFWRDYIELRQSYDIRISLEMALYNQGFLLSEVVLESQE
jgi:hypothetical protein